jgi:hypothetical protein
MKIKLFILLAFCSGQLLATDSKDANEFVIEAKPVKKKKMSSNELKEEIGQKTKQVFEHSTQLSEQLGKVQCSLSKVQQEAAKKADKPETTKNILLSSATVNQALGVINQEIASVQKMCSSVVEKLIDNHKPFKKASKTDLEQTLEQITSAQQTIQTSASSVREISTKTASDISKLASVLGEEEKKLKTMRTALNNDACLKNL